MPSSFQALHDETRPLALLEPETLRPTRTRVLPFASALALALVAVLFLI